MWRNIFLLGVFLTFSLAHATWVAQNAVVQRIVDGDTIHVSFERNTITKVRLLYIDTFETSRGNKMRSDIRRLHEQGYAVDEQTLLSKGREARQWLGRRIPLGTTVSLEWNSERPNDRHGRLLALVYARDNSRTSVNEELVLVGLARPLFVGRTRSDHRRRFEAAYQQAQRERYWRWMGR